jgi:dienelactone hydrolase
MTATAQVLTTSAQRAAPDPPETTGALAAHFDGLRDACLPALRFDRAGRPFDSWRDTLRPRVRAALGIPEVPSGRPRLRGVEAGQWHEEPGYRWQRVWLQTEADLRIPGFFVLPGAAALQAAGGRVPVTIACQGHAADGMRVSLGMVATEVYEKSIANGDRDLALQAVRHGFACLALEMRGFGELRLAADYEKSANNSCTRLSVLSIQIGRTLLGMRVHDVMAAVDFLLDRPEIDGRRIVLTGNSGGGTVTLTTGALEDRLAATIPSCAFSTFGASIQGVHHCPCNFVPGMSALADMSDLAGLAAPRPQLIISGKEDAIFPIDAVHEAFARAKEIYAAAGAPDALRLFVGQGGHRYYAEPVWPWLAAVLDLPEQWGDTRYRAAPPAAY